MLKKFNYLQPSLSFLFVFEIVKQCTCTRMSRSKPWVKIDYNRMFSFKESSFVPWNIDAGSKLICVSFIDEGKQNPL